MSSACEQDLGYLDAQWELDWDEARDILRESVARQHNFRFLDTVLADFLRTNKHEGDHWSLEELLQIDSSHPGKEFNYLNRNVLWTSTVWRRQGSHGKQICLKLHNDGFRYLSRPGPQRGRHTTSTSEQPGWLKLPWSEAEQHMPTLVSAVMPLYRGGIVWYNFLLKKVDLEFLQQRTLLCQH
ncbi:TPA: hypothetical protein ACH3X2_000748 [Trebouxia sp. C0005]